MTMVLGPDKKAQAAYAAELKKAEHDAAAQARAEAEVPAPTGRPEGAQKAEPPGSPEGGTEARARDPTEANEASAVAAEVETAATES